jgi:hypothetical protein
MYTERRYYRKKTCIGSHLTDSCCYDWLRSLRTESECSGIFILFCKFVLAGSICEPLPLMCEDGKSSLIKLVFITICVSFESTTVDLQKFALDYESCKQWYIINCNDLPGLLMHMVGDDRSIPPIF